MKRREFSDIFSDISALQDIHDPDEWRRRLEHLFGELFVCLSDTTKYYAVKVMNDPVIVDGILQECFIELWNYLLDKNTFPDEVSLFKWITIRIRGRLANERRRLLRLNFDSTFFSDVVDEDYHAEAGSYYSPVLPEECIVESTEELLISDERYAQLEPFLETLPPIYRDVYLLHCRSNLSFDKVAEELDTSRVQAFKLYHEALALIGEALEVDLDIVYVDYLHKAKKRLKKMEKKKQSAPKKSNKKGKQKKSPKRKKPEV